VNVSLVLLVVAIILFAIAAFSSRVGINSPVDLVAAGLFFWALSTLV